jgi:hypothetical protein
MKTLIASVMISFIFGISSTSFAQTSNSGSFKSAVVEQGSFVIHALKTGNIDVTLEKPEGEKRLIQVVDSHGLTLASIEIGKNRPVSRTRFDLNELPDGVYHVVVIEGYQKQVKDVVLSTTLSDTFRTINAG